MLNYMGGAGFHIIFAHANILFFSRTNLYDSDTKKKEKNEYRSPALWVDSLPAEPQGKPENTGVGSLSVLQWIFPTQE